MERPRTLIEVLDFPARLLRRELRTFGPVLLGVGFIAVLPTWGAQPFLATDFTPGQLPPLSFWLAYPLLLVTFLLQIAGSLVGVEAVRRADAGEPAPVGALLHAARPANYFTSLAQMVVFFVTYTCCLFLPGLVWMALTALLVPVMLIEGRAGLDAFRRVFELVRGQVGGVPVWVHLVAFGLVVGVLTLGVAGFAVLPQMAWVVFSVLRDSSGGFSIASLTQVPWFVQIPVNVLGLFGSVLTQGYWASGIVLLTRAAIAEREGEDLQAAIDAQAT